MATKRPLTPFELAHFDRRYQLTDMSKAEVALHIGTTVRGAVDLDILRRVLAELAAGHALLRATVVRDTADDLHFELLEGYQPPLEVREGGAEEYWRLINSPHDWSDGLFKVIVLREGDIHQIVLVAHHGICDGRSMFPLVGEMWERYGAHLAGSPLPPSDSDHDLVDGVDAQLAASVTDAEVDAFLGQLAAIAQASGPDAPAPLRLPVAGDGVEDALGRFRVQYIELSPAETGAVIATARAAGFSVNSLLTGMALTALRPELDGGAEPAMLLAAIASDLRAELVPPLTGSTVLNCVGGVLVPLFAGTGADPIELGMMVEAGVKGAVDARFSALLLRALTRGLDPVAAGLPTVLPTMSVSNIGLIPEYPVPVQLELVRNFVFGMGVGHSPVATIYTIGDRLTIQVGYDTVEHSHEQIGRITEALREQLRRVYGVPAAMS
ncbi:hypothetical protein [Nocardia sp. NPDC127526]|uniref:phthiocerol/phthiodiolone dimycocerosyl transferase family protein n=1 Tax=Nocardia sp. NPDC127526 TaxID=3345393 RepID=UPI0036440160